MDILLLVKHVRMKKPGIYGIMMKNIKVKQRKHSVKLT